MSIVTLTPLTADEACAPESCQVWVSNMGQEEKLYSRFTDGQTADSPTSREGTSGRDQSSDACLALIGWCHFKVAEDEDEDEEVVN